MEFLLLGITLWLIVIVSLIFMVRGFQEKSPTTIFFSVFGYLLPMLYFSIYELYFIAFALLSIIPFVAAFKIKS
ncbi:hypothetical protein [Ureibacillus manganicus]|uniref:Uncharacterized protein n=1 Tax=Ureibacillus manganicus DSM 26584 TaxID=1384049 RepID=A0A0A3I0X8_9BACL|nr:hypothetical protein [Ureibacillus manganicus]KGR78491.1 hypothetical protein CD29_10605 [Ureibacillus manganicus DSM 26584]